MIGLAELVCNACNTDQLLTHHVDGCPGAKALALALGRWVWKTRPSMSELTLETLAYDAAKECGVQQLARGIERILKTKETMWQYEQERLPEAHARIAVLQSQVDDYKQRLCCWPVREDIEEAIADAQEETQHGDVIEMRMNASRRIDALFRQQLDIRDDEVDPISG